jgi:acetolactate synthase small subunit
MFAKRVRTYRATSHTINNDAPVGIPHSPDAREEAAEQANRVRGRHIDVSTHSHADEHAGSRADGHLGAVYDVYDVTTGDTV